MLVKKFHRKLLFEMSDIFNNAMAFVEVCQKIAVRVHLPLEGGKHQGQAREKKRSKSKKREGVREKERGGREKGWKNEQVAGRRAYGLHPYLLTSAKSITCLGV